jgi:hypothetical protein
MRVCMTKEVLSGVDCILDIWPFDKKEWLLFVLPIGFITTCCLAEPEPVQATYGGIQCGYCGTLITHKSQLHRMRKITLTEC